MRVLILYPSAFQCQSKFNRKLQAILARSSAFSVVYLQDPHGYIQSLFAEDARVSCLEQAASLEEAAATHAVVFDDGEEFPDERAWLVRQELPMREIKIKITRVVNIDKQTEFAGLRSTPSYEYIGRGAYWGNPHSMFEAGETREEVIRKFKYDFDYDKFIKIDVSRVHELAGKRLGCFCKPSPCHGDVLADFLNRYDDGL